jgi:hypothetical protein
MRQFAPYKWFLKSKTILINLVAAIPYLLTELGTLPQFIQYRDEFALILIIVNIILRFKTDQPITISKTKADTQ